MTLATPTRRRLLGVIFSALLVAGLPACQKTSGPQLPAGPYSVAEVFDGDSFNLQAKGGQIVRVRIAGIDAPEKTQPYSNKAKDSLTELLQSDSIGLQPVKVDAYDRWVANVSIGDRDLGLAQIRRGYAWYFVRYKKDISEAQQQRYAEAERSARNARLGLWAGIDASVRNPALMPEPPWKFRERTRKEK
jgi:endonuclease YncB( thermonuclease family)